ncbi:DNA/RNA helicase domain-containing protein [Alloiococcus sp. CFN-8]|uniref:DNA/RNA helicase domain-containing protein n=1 Tax=Alloiococcus sp. CFN-8 TaxID=3416081 RepID=UPI003CF774A3
MLVYDSTKSAFLDDVVNDAIADKIYERFRQKIGKTTKSEIASWNNSMGYMYKVLNDDRIPKDAGIAIEFRIPYTSKRVDFILSGKDEKGENAAVVIELKQWSSAKEVIGKDGIIRTILNGRQVDTTHPSYQAWSYATHIEDYNETVQDRKISLTPCAYLHNYVKQNPDAITHSTYDYYLEKAPVFLKGDVIKLRDFINKYIKYGDNKETLYMIENGKIRPSKSLQDALSSMLEGNREFIMLDDQKLVYETAIQAGEKSYKDSKKRVLIIEGGPGTGKSVLAINLLVELTKRNLVCQYVTKNSAPRNVYASKLSGSMRRTRIDNLFKGSGSYINTPRNEFDALIVDEAHRLNAKSGMFKNLGENQIKEIINAAKFSIFFIDEAQKIDMSDIGSIDGIKSFCRELDAEYDMMRLESQFRCNGSDGYIAWVEDVLQIRNTANSDGFELDYDVQVLDSPIDLSNKIFELNKKNNKARLLAGYCWNWIREGKNRSDIHDIEIKEYDFAMSWNLGNSTTWAIDPDSVNQIGCIHTSQGLEFDYVGVIIGDDLRYEEDKIVTDFFKRARTDQSIKGLKGLYKSNPDEALAIADKIIKNTYRTLLTRGQKGCYIYCTDEELRNYLKRRILEMKDNKIENLKYKDTEETEVIESQR